MARKTARVVAVRQADVYLLVRVLKCYVWMTVGSFFLKTGNRHGVAVIIMNGETGEILPPTPYTIGVIVDRDQEQRRIENCIEKCERLFAHPEHATSSQSADEKAGLFGGAIRIGQTTANHLLIGLAGLGAKMDEAVALAACEAVLPVSDDDKMAVSFRSGMGPNVLINDTRQYHHALKSHLVGRKVEDFNPDFEELVDFKRFLVLPE